MNGMTGYWNFEKALREAGEERRWTYYAMMQAWITRQGLHVIVGRNPVHVRIAGVHGGVIEFGSVPDALEFIGEEPLPPLPIPTRAELDDRLDLAG